MQPFDALSIRAVLQEAKPLLINRKVDKIFQLGRDEVLITLRSKGGTLSLFLSAQSVYGRMCLVRVSSNSDGEKGGEKGENERYQIKATGSSPPNFCLVLRKHLTGATLVGVEQPPGERIIDFVFSTVDEVGKSSLKVLTAEIMGRHSNLIFWEKATEKIISSSHAVTKDMSRQREVLPNLPYERPPGQDRQSIFLVSESALKSMVQELRQNYLDLNKNNFSGTLAPQAIEQVQDKSSVAVQTASRLTASSDAVQAKPVPVTIEHWLLSNFTGLGKHLCEEVVIGTGLESTLTNSIHDQNFADKVWLKIKDLQSPPQYRPYMRGDLSRYTVIGWYSDIEESTWTKFPSVNDMVENYFRALEVREHFIQLREKIKAEIASESSRLQTRKHTAEEHLSADSDITKLKLSGDMILTSITTIKPGQSDLIVDWNQDNGGEFTVKLNPNLSAAQNAQSYYRQYAKLRSRQGAAQSTIDEVNARLDFLLKLKTSCEEAKEIGELRKVRETLTGRKPQVERNKSTEKQPASKGGGGPKHKIMNLTSSDGWTIFVGRNRLENDQLINKVANPNDIWLHVLGQGGAHVLIRVPTNKTDPPKTTIQEAAQIAARLSKAGTGAKVRVVYTQCKYVKKIAANKPGLVRYENERSIEIDTGSPMPKMMKKLFH